MSNQKGNLPIIGVLLLVIIVGVGGYYLGSKITNKNESSNFQSQSSQQINYISSPNDLVPSTTEYHSGVSEWKELISYTVPVGWKKTTQSYGEENLPAIQSPDLLLETEGFYAGKPKEGLLIYINRGLNNSKRTLQQEVDEYRNTAGVEEVTRVLVGGVPALRIFIVYEGVLENYLILKDNSQWFISVIPPQTSREAAQSALDKNREQIDEFLKSIKFK